MCYRKPGPRCATTARARLQAAEHRLAQSNARIEKAEADGNPTEISVAIKDADDAFRQTLLAQREYDLTTEGIQAMRERGEYHRAKHHQQLRDDLIAAASGRSDGEHFAGDDHDRCTACGHPRTSGHCGCDSLTHGHGIETDLRMMTAELSETGGRVTKIVNGTYVQAYVRRPSSDPGQDQVWWEVNKSTARLSLAEATAIIAGTATHREPLPAHLR